MSGQRYTDEELKQLNEQIWSDPPASEQRNTNVPCVCCGADTLVKFSWSSTGEDGCGIKLLIINCDACGRSGRVKPAEIPCPDLDDDQMLEVVQLYQRGQRAFCPTCQTALHVQEAHTLGSLGYSASCYRGGATGQLVRPR